jgi:hypothetical protein
LSFRKDFSGESHHHLQLTTSASLVNFSLLCVINYVYLLTLFPASLLAAEYHQRWEIENTIDELKTHLNARKILICSLKLREVVQENYGWLIGHYAVRCLIDLLRDKEI